MVKRYTCFIAADSGNYTFAAMRPDAEGISVLHTDYEKLEKENTRLREALERCNELLVVAQLTASKALQAQP